MKKILFLLVALPAFFNAKAQCPDLSTPRKPMASSFHSSVMITYDSIVRYWGDAANISGTGNEPTPLTLAKSNYGGASAIALSVAAGSVSATQHQLYVHSTVGIYGWGYSNQTIDGGTTGAIGVTNIALPSGVSISQVSYIEAAAGGLALVTTSGTVYVKQGGATAGPYTALIYGDGSTGSTMNTAWHQVLTAVATPLTNVTRLSFSSRGAMALTATGTVYVWGENVLLGNGTVAGNQSFATLVTNPSGVTPADVNIITKHTYSTLNQTATQFILGTDGKLYGVGENWHGPLGQGNETDVTSWVTVKGPALSGTLDNIVQIGSNNPFVLNNGVTGGVDNGGYAIGALASDGKLYLWGDNNSDMIGGDTLVTPSLDSTFYTVPRVPPNFKYNNAAIGFFEMGGHTTAAFLAGSSKFCYIGHRIRGSMGDGTVVTATRKSFDCINTPEEYVCPPSPSVGCPLPSASDIVASSLHATLAINGQPSVAFWGEAASSAEPGINMTAARTLFEYNGSPKGVAASAVNTTPAAAGTQMWLHTTLGIWGWGYSANTIQANRVNSAPITELPLPAGVAASDISFIRSSRGGIALITNSGNVWVRAGNGSACSPRVYGDGSASLDAAGSTTWHQVTTAVATPLTGVVEMSFGGTAAMAITSSGTAYVWGDNTYLGDGTAAANRNRAALMTLHSDFTGSVVPRTAEIIQSGSLEAAQFIRGSNNKVYSLGRNANGVLGIGSATFTAISTSWNALSLVGISKLSSNNPYADGYYSIGAITLTGNVYLWGSNSNGMLGQPLATTNVTSPTLATTIAANDANSFEVGGNQTIIFAKSTSQFYFAGRSQGGSRADGSADADVTPFTLAGTVANCANVTFNLSGNLYNDINGLTDNLVNGTAISTVRTSAMHANLLDEGGTVIATTPISGGAYSFTAYPFGNYFVQVSTIAGTVFSPAPTNTLPTNWVYTGEQIGTVAGVNVDAGAPDGRIPVALSANRTNVNFGVEQLPTPNAATLPGRYNPGGTNTSVITTAFTGTDTTGTVTKFRITAFPAANATTLVIGGTPYTSGTFPGAGVTFNAGTTVAVDPVNGAVTVVIPFVAIDNADRESTSSANVTVPFILVPPIANNIIAPRLNSHDTAKAIPQLKASSPMNATITDFNVLTLPPASEGVLYYCATAPATCALGSLTAVSVGTPLTAAQSASLYFNPAQTFTGNSSFTYSVTDANGLTSNVANYRIPVFNNPPVTQNIRTAQIIDTDHAAPIPYLLGADGDGVIASYTVSSIPSATQGVLTYCTTPPATGCGTVISGTTVLTPAQMMTLKFDPTLGFSGNYVFNYIATDDNGNTSNTSTFTIPVVPLSGTGGNLPPVATNITSQNINNSLGATPIPNLLGTDPDGVVTTYTIGSTIPNTVTEGTLYYCVTPGVGCALTAVVANQTMSPAQAQTLQFDPVSSFIGTASFTYTVTDNGGTPLTSAPATYNIPVVNNPPVANPNSVNPILNTLVTPTLLPPLSGNDADGTIASYNINTVPAASQGTLQYCVTPGVGCALTTISGPVTGLTPAQAATLNFLPNSGFTGNYVFTFSTVDNNSLVSQPATFTIPVVATAAAVGAPPIAYSYNNAPINSTGTALLSTALTGTDPDGTVSNYTITSIPAANHGSLTYCTTPPATGCGTAVTVGTVMSAAQAATVLFTPNADFIGIATFNYTNKDNDSNVSNTATVTIPVVNNPPFAANINNTAINRSSSAVTLNSLSSTDGDGSVVSYTILTVPSTDNGTLRLCTAPPSTGCTAVTPGQVLTPAQIGNLAFTPNPYLDLPVISFLYATQDNSGNLSNNATVNIPIINAAELPIELLSFNAVKQGRNALISWTTGVEKQGIRYDLLHSVDGKDWVTINTQKAKAQGMNTNRYDYLHTSVSGGTQYYKLKLVDVDQTVVFSPVRTLTFDAQNYSIQLQPNPVTDKLYLSTSDGSNIQSLAVFNSEGLKVQEFSNLTSGSSIDMSSYIPGLYMIKIMDKNGEAQVIKVTRK